MAQIEAFLRTGEAPPAAPEPAPVTRGPLPPTRPYEVGGPDPLDSAAVRAGARRRRAWWERLLRKPGGGGLRSAWGRRRDWSEQGLAPGPSRRSGPGEGPSGARARPGQGRPSARGWAGGAVGARGATGAVGARGATGAGGGRRGSGGRGGRGGDRPPPTWTPARALVVSGAMVLLLVLPYALARHTSGAGPDGADRASAAPAGPGYAFLRVNPTGTPVRWNPCQAIQYQLDLAAAPAWAYGDIARAIADVSQATGIPFVYSGPTNHFPSQSVALGSAQAPWPVVIAWASATQTRTANLAVDTSEIAGAFPGETDALARTVPVMAQDRSTGQGVYVSGSVVIGSAASSLPAGFGSGGDGVLLLHELGQLVGLAEMTAAGQVMDPSAVSDGVHGLGLGDRAGLDRLGRSSGCLSLPAHASLAIAAQAAASGTTSPGPAPAG